LLFAAIVLAFETRNSKLEISNSGPNAAFSGNEVLGAVVMKLVAVWTLKGADIRVGNQALRALARCGLALE
jgi:hypothetical protein